MATLMQVPEHVLARLAADASATLVERSYTAEGCSRDTRRAASKKEAKIITDIIYGGLLAIRFGADAQSVADTCEFIGGRQLGRKINCFDSIYVPLKSLAAEALGK